MPHGEIHKRKLRKNLAVAAMILLWCALIWAVTMIKIARADEGYREEGRAMHQEKMMQTQQGWDAAFHEKEPERAAASEQREQARAKQADHVASTQNFWIEDWNRKAPARLAAEDAQTQARARQLEKTEGNPPQWWAIWQRHRQEKSESF